MNRQSILLDKKFHALEKQCHDQLSALQDNQLSALEEKLDQSKKETDDKVALASKANLNLQVDAQKTLNDSKEKKRNRRKFFCILSSK